MHARLPLAFALVALAGFFGCSPAAPAESPEQPAGSESASNESEATDPASQPEASNAPDPSKNPAKEQYLPDDYAITNGDCSALGKQYANAIRADQEAQLSPKLKDAQREQAKKNIDEVAVKMGEQWRESCASSLVGQIRDRASMKCALAATSVKAFDDCLNAQPPKP